MRKEDLVRRLEAVFQHEQAVVLADTITDAYDTLVKASDFSELKTIVAELGEAQKRTEERLEELAEAQKKTEERVEELAEAQKRTEERLEELAEAQKKTEERVEKLAEAQRRTEETVAELVEAQKRTEKNVADLAKAMQLLTRELRETRRDLGGLSRSVSYALENEAYRFLPAFLKERYNIEVTRKMIRTEIRGEEINLLGHALKDGKPILLVGEVKLRLDEKRRGRGKEIFELLEKKISAVRSEYPEIEIIPMLVTHYARPGILERAQEKGIIVVQSFEW